MNKQTLFIFFCCLVFTGSRETVRAQSDTTEVLQLLERGNRFESRNLDSANTYYQLAGQLAKKIHYVNGILKYYSNYTFILNQQGKLREGLKVNLEALRLAYRSGSKLNVGRCLFNVGSSYNNLGEYDAALKYYLDAIKIFEAKKDELYLTAAYDNVGGVFANSGQFEKAMVYQEKAVRLAEKRNDSLDIAKTYINKGIIETSLGRLDQSEKSLQHGMKFAGKVKQAYLECTALNALAEVYHARKDYVKSNLFSLQALNLSTNIHSRYGQMESYKIMTRNFSGLGQYDSVIVMGEKAIAFGKASGYASDLHNYYALVARAYELKKKFDQALFYYKTSNRLSDSISGRNIEQKMEKLERDYAAVRNNEKILSLEKREKQHQLLITSLCALLVIIVLVAIIIYIRIKHKRNNAEQNAFNKEKEIVQLRNEQQLMAVNFILKGQEEERLRISKDLHDGLGGLLSGIKLTLLGKNKDMVSVIDHRAIAQLDHAIDEMRRISKSMMPEALDKFGLIDALKDVCDAISEGEKIKIKCQFYGLEERLGQTTEINLYRILLELINNAIKHAEAGEVYLQFIKDGHDIEITLEDNGIGFDLHGAGDLQGMGLRNVKSRVEYLGGKINIRSERNIGTTITIEIKEK